MSTLATTKQDDLQSRLPDSVQFFPELAAISRAMSKATLNGSIPQTTISLVQLLSSASRSPVRPPGNYSK
jgi:hypothetical protein